MISTHNNKATDISPLDFLRQDALQRLEWFKVTENLAQYAVFPTTQAKLATFLPFLPTDERHAIFSATEELILILQSGKEVTLPPIDFELFEKQLKRHAVLSPLALHHVHLLCRAMREGRDFSQKARRENSPYPLLIELLSTLTAQPALETALAKSVDSEGNILSTASPELHAARSRQESARRRIVDALESLIRRPGVRDALQDAIWVQRDGRYVLPVRSDRRSDIQGVPHGVSATGSTIFVEPTHIVEAQASLEQATVDVQIEENRVLRTLSESAAAVKDALFLGMKVLGRYDELLARSRFGRSIDGVRPQFKSSGHGPRFDFDNARHPLFIIEDKPCVPNPLALTRTHSTHDREPNIWVLTGPNAGGKTVAMRTVGLLTLMALGGLLISARNATLHEYDNIFVELGDRQSREEDLSTFSGHLMQMKRMIDNATPSTLILLDEGFVGTDPGVGMALARATLEHLADLSATVVITTHFSNLKTLADSDPRFYNASMEFEPKELRPTYRLLNGLPGQSYAIELATRLDFAGPILEKARKYHGEEGARMERLLQDLQVKRSELAGELEKQAQVRQSLEEELASVRAEQEKIVNMRNTLFSTYQTKIQKRLNAFENRLHIRERQFEKHKDSLLREAESIHRLKLESAGDSSETTVTEPQLPKETKRAPANTPKNQTKGQAEAQKGSRSKPITLGDFSALANLSLPKNKRNEGQQDLDERADSFRQPKQMTSRSLLDEARDSLGTLEKSVGRLDDSFRKEVDDLLALEGKVGRDAVKAVQKAKEETADRPAEFWQPSMRAKTQRFREPVEVVKKADNKGMVECLAGLVKLKIHFSELKTISEAAGSREPSQKAKQQTKPSLPQVKSAAEMLNYDIPSTYQHKGNTCDLRGQLVDSALDRLGEFLDRAWRQSMDRVIIIHGHGTGKVKQAVRDYIIQSGYPVTFRPGGHGEGSDGVTVVQFEN